MLGWINDCIEKLVIDKFGVDTWHVIKTKAGCNVPDGGFIKLEHYTDKSTVDLAVATSEVSGLTVDQVFEAVGEFWVHFVNKEGYKILMLCQGSNLKEWMTNINAIHQHLQTTFPNKMVMPQFWCEECTDGSGPLSYTTTLSEEVFLLPWEKVL
jgi:guanylate cyclase soluble subunit beta